MALATNTATGTIKLAGDLAGNNDATAPELTSTGITAGEYVIPVITVDGKGRITSVTSTDDTAILPFLPIATDTTKGILEVDTTNGLIITAGVLDFDTTSIQDATDSVKGVVQIDTANGLTITAGLLGFDTTTIQDATDSVKGIVKVVESNGLSITSGVLSFTPGAIQDATDSVKGIVQIDTANGLTIASGVLGFTPPSSYQDATDVVKGIVQIDTNSSLTISAGVLGTTDASSTEKGVVQIDDTTGLSVSAGVLSVVLGNASTLGVVKPATGSGITISSGLLSLNASVVFTSNSQPFNTTQTVDVNSLTYAASITPNGSTSNTMSLTMTGNATLENFTNLVAGTYYSVVITQDGVGSRLLSYGSAFKFKGGITPTLSTSGNSVDILSCYSDGTNLYSTLTKGFA